MNKTKMLITGLVMAMAAGQLGAVQMAPDQMDNGANLRNVFDNGTGTGGKISVPSVKAESGLGAKQSYQPSVAFETQLAKKNTKPAGPEISRRSLKNDTSGTISEGQLGALIAISVIILLAVFAIPMMGLTAAILGAFASSLVWITAKRN